MKNWYHCILGQVKGPFSLLQMEKMIEQREIGLDDLIYQSGEKEWTFVKNRWQFQKAILKRNSTNAMPKKDWVVLKQKNTSGGIEHSDLCNYQYIHCSTEEVLEALHGGEITYSHWIWTYGMKSWKCIRNLPVFNKHIRVDDKKKKSDIKPLNLGPVTDIELYQSIMKAKPPSELISSLIDMEKKPNEAHGPNLTKQFGNLKFDPYFSKQNKSINSIRSKTLSHKTTQQGTFLNHVSSLSQSKNKNHRIMNKNFFIASIAFIFLCISADFLFPYYMNEKLHKSVKNISLQYEVLHNGLELHFWIRQYAKEKVLLKIENDKKKTLTANEFEYNIKLVLDQNGHAVLRLDHLGLAEGYYTFLGKIDENKVFHRRFFVGNNPQEFSYKLSKFHQTRQLEKQKLEKIRKKEIMNVIAEKKQPVLPQSVETLYGHIRQLEKGYDKYNNDLTEWKSFYSSWESSFNQLQPSALGYIKEELDMELTNELQVIKQELKIMGEQMDRSIKESHKEGFDPLSPQVAVFLEKMKDNNRF